MDKDIKRSNTSNILRIHLKHSTTGQGLTGLTSASSGLIISTICDNEATATAYTVAGSTIEGITTLGTFATPTATKIRFKEVDATNHPGLYEIQADDTRFAIASSKQLNITLSGATNLADTNYTIGIVDNVIKDTFDIVNNGTYGNSALHTEVAKEATLGTKIPSNLAFTSGNVNAQVKGTDNIGLSAAQKADVNTEVDNALNTAIPGSPTADSVNQRMKSVDDFTDGSFIAFTVVTDAGNSGSQFKTDLPNANNSAYQNGWVQMTSGDLALLPPRKVNTWNGSTKIVSLTSAFPSTPVDGALGIIITR